MMAEVYDQTAVQSASGAIERSWNYTSPIKTIFCQASGIVDGGIRVVGSTERWEEKYQNVEWVHIATDAQITKRQRIGNIMNSQGELLFEGVIFEVLGITPILNPFGALVEYDVLAQRAEKP
jgi:hypothetical protein